jgi:hypothetical protein
MTPSRFYCTVNHWIPGEDGMVTSDLLPEGYADLLAQVKADVQSTRLCALRTANTELTALYFNWTELEGPFSHSFCVRAVVSPEASSDPGAG